MAGSKPTAEHLKRRSESPDFVRTVLPATNTPPNRSPVHRLSFSGGDGYTWSYEDYARAVERSALPGHAFFLDTCFLIKDEIPAVFWNALRRFDICIVPLIAHELERRLKSPEKNQDILRELRNAQLTHTPGITFLPNLDLDSETERGALYYIRLLAFRKQIYHFAKQNFTSEHGIDPLPDQLDRIVQTLVSDRGMKLASKGRKDFEKPNFLADESLLVRAFLYGLTNGCDVTVLTRDSDLLEQFYKLQYLVDTHYRSYLIAEHYSLQPLNFVEQVGDVKTDDLPFENLRILRVPAGIDERVLPSDSRFANVHVDYLGEEQGKTLFSTYRFSADRKMLEVFRIKGRTNGLNTDRLNGSNLHRCFVPNDKFSLGEYCAISEDKYYTYDKMRWAYLDIEMCLKRFERSSRYAVLESAPEDISPASKKLGIELCGFPCIPLVPTHSPESVEMDQSSLGVAIRLQLPCTRLRATGGFAANLPNELAAILQVATGCSNLVETRQSLASMEILNDPEVRKIFDYYLALLAHRKLFGKVCETSLQKEGNLQPTRKQIQKRVEQHLGVKSWPRISSFMDDSSLSVFDEDRLAVLTVLSAIYKGEDTIVLTDSTVFVEQIWALFAILIGHYRSWCLGSHLSKDLNRFSTGEGSLANGFRGNAWMVEIPMESVQDAMVRFCFPIRIQVWLVEKKSDRVSLVYPIGVALEMAMRKMFECKINNEFRSTDKLGNRNLYFQWTRNSLVRKGTCTIGEDVMVRIGSQNFPMDERLGTSITAVPGLDLSLAGCIDRDYPFPWSSVAERAHLRENRKNPYRKSKSKKRR